MWDFRSNISVYQDKILLWRDVKMKITFKKPNIENFRWFTKSRSFTYLFCMFYFLLKIIGSLYRGQTNRAIKNSQFCGFCGKRKQLSCALIPPPHTPTVSLSKTPRRNDWIKLLVAPGLKLITHYANFCAKIFNSFAAL